MAHQYTHQHSRLWILWLMSFDGKETWIRLVCCSPARVLLFQTCELTLRGIVNQQSESLSKLPLDITRNRCASVCLLGIMISLKTPLFLYQYPKRHICLAIFSPMRRWTKSPKAAILQLDYTLDLCGALPWMIQPLAPFPGDVGLITFRWV